MKQKLLGYRIKEVRKSCRLTGEQLAERCDLSATYIRQLETGSRIPSLPVLLSISEALHVSPNHLLKDQLSADIKENDDYIVGLWRQATPNQQKMMIALLEDVIKYS